MPKNWSLRRCLILALAVCLCCNLSAQVSVQGDSRQQKAATTAAQDHDHPSEVNLDFQMTPAEAQRLLGSINDVLGFDSTVTGLPVRESVTGMMTSRDEIKELMKKRLEDKSLEQRAQRSSAVLMKLGLLPRGYDARQFASETIVKQLAGYYDAKVKTMYLLNWLPAESQMTVLAHELDHALQDQSFHLPDWFKQENPEANLATGGDASEQRAARRAVAEGHATAVMFEYVLNKQGKSLKDVPAISPDRLQMMIDRSLHSDPANPAPLILREGMTFPYMYGLNFIDQVLLKAGRDAAYTGVFKRPPISTREILEPEAYLANEKLPALPLPHFEDVLGSGYKKLENGSMGEFDCMILMRQFEKTNARQIASNWRGDYLYAAGLASATPIGSADKDAAEKIQPQDVNLVFVSRWATPAAAREFASFYEDTVSRRYSDVKPLEPPSSETIAWNTSEGRVSVQVHGALVIAIEGFDEPISARLSEVIVKTDQ